MSNVSTIVRTENMITNNEKSLKTPKGVIRTRKSKKNMQHNGHKKRTNNHLQNNAQTNKDREPLISLRNEEE